MYDNDRIAWKPRRRPGIGPKVLTTMILLTGLCIAYAGTTALAGVRSEIRSTGVFGSGAVRLAFADATGKIVQGPHFLAMDARPGMPPSRAAITIWNQGSTAATYSIVSANVRSPNPHPLVGGPVLAVIDPSGAELYRGTISALHFSGPSLEPGDSRTYVITIAWPSPTGRTDPGQNASLSFDLRGTGLPAE